MDKFNTEDIEHGKNLILEEKYDEALDHFKKLHKKEKDNTLYPNYIGITYFLQEEYKTASEYFKTAIELNPENWFAYRKLGEICTIKKMKSCAKKYLTETIERDPKDLYSLLNLALIFQNEQEEIALELVESALSIDPSNAVAHYLQGSICLNKDEYKTAKELLKKVVENKPRHGLAWYKLGLAYFKSNNYKRGIDVLTEALQFIKKPYLYNLLGLLNLYEINIQDAIDSFKEAIKLEPDNSSFWINLADAYFRVNKLNSAKMCLKEALAVANNDYHLIIVWTNFANYYEKSNQLDYSLYCLERAKEGVNLKEEESVNEFEVFEPKMELIHKIKLRIEDLRKQGIEAAKPEENLEEIKAQE
ncbi:MAG: tetratricopeptide repeat protein [Promethearchaeia archaeon]